MIIITFLPHPSPLHSGWPDVAKLLCEAGADMECRSFRQNTPLHVAVWASTGDELPASGRSLATPSSRNVAVARVLLAQGANKEAANYRLNRPLHIVAGNHQSKKKYKFRCLSLHPHSY
jgi:ankyrin repeat protein